MSFDGTKMQLHLAVLHVEFWVERGPSEFRYEGSYHPLGEMGHLTISLSESCQQKCKQFCLTLKFHLYQFAILIKRPA